MGSWTHSNGLSKRSDALLIIYRQSKLRLFLGMQRAMSVSRTRERPREKSQLTKLNPKHSLVPHIISCCWWGTLANNKLLHWPSNNQKVWVALQISLPPFLSLSGRSSHQPRKTQVFVKVLLVSYMLHWDPMHWPSPLLKSEWFSMEMLVCLENSLWCLQLSTASPILGSFTAAWPFLNFLHPQTLSCLEVSLAERGSYSPAPSPIG